MFTVSGMFIELTANVMGNVIMGQSLSLYVDARASDPGCQPSNETNGMPITVPPDVLKTRVSLHHDLVQQK